MHLQCFFLCLILQLLPHPSYPKMLHLVETTSLQPGKKGGPAQREGGLCTNALAAHVSSRQLESSIVHLHNTQSAILYS